MYVLILLAIFFILLLVITAVACYYDCENRRSSLFSGKYDSIKMDTAPIVPVKYVGKRPAIIHRKKIREDVRIYNLLISCIPLYNIRQIIHRFTQP